MGKQRTRPIVECSIVLSIEVDDDDGIHLTAYDEDPGGPVIAKQHFASPYDPYEVLLWVVKQVDALRRRASHVEVAS